MRGWLWLCAALWAVPVLASEAPGEVCAGCHAREVAEYRLTGMGRSLGRPAGHPGGRFEHRRSGARVTIRSSEEALRHRVDWQGLTAEYPATYFVGSGNQGRSYLIELHGYLFQSPASYYNERGRWDASPGFENDAILDFNRPVTAECLFCHAGQARPVAGTENRYLEPPFAAEAISCDRCHGSADRHLAAPVRGTIVNPAKLGGIERDSVCEQCHLSGEARIPNPGREVHDFLPGMRLEEVFAVYLYEKPEPESGAARLKVVSHAEQLALSACARASAGAMWCGSCHSVHDYPRDRAVYYRQRCQSCHSEEKLTGHPQPKEDCAGCHMPRRQAYDGAHTAFTDHQILRRPAAETRDRASRKLIAWREPEPRYAARNLGLALISAGERDQAADHLTEGFRLLAEAEAAFRDDAAVLTSLGSGLMRRGRPREAAHLFARAAALEPGRAHHQLNLGAAWQAAGEHEKALTALEQAIARDPGLEDAYRLAAAIHGEAGNPQAQRVTLERWLAFFPQSFAARQALRPRRGRR